MFIYLVENKINGKIYVGKTEKPDIQQRWKRHLADSKYKNTRFCNAIKKYGSENFKIYVVERTGNVGRDKLNEREKYWIETLDPEYNMTKGGDGGWIHNQTGKKWKIRDTSNMKGRKSITPLVLEGRKKLTGGNNYQSIYVIFTPWGKFDTWTAAISSAKVERKNGNPNVITNDKTLQKYCLSNTRLNTEGRRTPAQWRGKFTKDLGFYVEKKNG